MTNKQTDKNAGTQKPKVAEQSKQSSSPRLTKPTSPMDKFNDAMRKILSVPKKDIKRK